MDKSKISKNLPDKNKMFSNQQSKNSNKVLNNENNEELNAENFNNLNYLIQLKQLSKSDNDYRKKLDERMDLLMEKIDENISNNKYNELNTIISNYKNNSLKYNNKVTKKGNLNNNKNDKNNKYINISNELNNNKSQILESKKEESEKSNEKIGYNKSAIFPTKVQIVCKRDNEINNRLLKRCKLLENETNYLKFKLNNVEKQKEFMQNIILKNENINRSLFDIFLVEYYKKIALNWRDVSDQIIDELIFDEIHEFTNIKLKQRSFKRQKEKEAQKEQEKINKIISPLEIEEFLLFNLLKNLFIKQS